MLTKSELAWLTQRVDIEVACDSYRVSGLDDGYDLDPDLQDALVVVEEGDDGEVVDFPFGRDFQRVVSCDGMLTFLYRHLLAPCTIESGAEDVLMEIRIVASAIRHQLERRYVVFDDPQLQVS